MSASQLIFSAWAWEPSVALGCAALLVGYFGLLRSRPNKQSLFFVAGVLVLLFSLVSPLDTLADTYLFSAHMIQHLLMILFVPPLLLLGTPAWFVERLLRNPLLARLERVLRKPAIAWLLGIGILWIWHWPLLYDAALGNEGIHIVEHLTFLVTATVFWWPVLSPIERSRITPIAGVLYLILTSISNAALGIILTFAAIGLYSPYLHPTGDPRILSLIRDSWGVSASSDQTLGGIIMWVPGGLVFLCAALGMLGHWYSMPEEEEETAIFTAPTLQQVAVATQGRKQDG
ncbi:MAG: cytochrome c oxidase assembly protein [Chloroflexi bacterium]|nr:cytochrome c oxidase assembly protein [Chloroflexota bacterium]